MWEKDKQYHVSEIAFDENMAENINVEELKKYGHYWNVSFIIHT